MQGQIRLRGERIAAQHRNTHLLRNVHAIGGREAFEARCQNNDHHLPRGAVRQQGTVRIQIGLPTNRHQENKATNLCENESAVIRAAPAWGHASCITATWEPMIPGSDWEATSSVCIRFSQVRPLGGEGNAAATRRQVRQRLVTMLNEIRVVCRLENKPFEDSDVYYARR